jgi:predicted DNA-binding protein with PD1-like motif
MTELSIDLDPGDNIVERLTSIAKARSVNELWIVAVGEVEDIELSVARGMSDRHSMTIPGSSDLVSMTGFVGSKTELFVTVAQHGSQGHIVAAGKLVRGTAVFVKAAVIASPTTPLPRAAVEPLRSVQQEFTPPVAAAEPREVRPLDRPTKIVRPASPVEDNDIYPEEGDLVTHFAFGRCVVVFSDGERIRLQQEGEGRVREVALSMLKISGPTESDGKKHFDLSRKN